VIPLGVVGPLIDPVVAMSCTLDPLIYFGENSRWKSQQRRGTWVVVDIVDIVDWRNVMFSASAPLGYFSFLEVLETLVL
jgi:hypothetical protein